MLNHRPTRRPIRRRNEARADVLYARAFGGPLYPADDYGDFIRSKPCCCGRNPKACGRVQGHHWISRGAGGTWREMVPLGDNCHLEVHAIGSKTFQTERGISFREIAAACVAEYEQAHPEIAA